MIRHHSLGPSTQWGSWSWSWSKGDTFGAIAYDDECAITGWAMLTNDIDRLPVVGVYVLEDHRGTGLSKVLLTTLVNWLTPEFLPKGSEIFASFERWSAYPGIIASTGHLPRIWE